MLGLALALSPGQSAPTYSAEATSLFARMTVQPSAQRKALINAMMVDLKVKDIWRKLDALWVMAAHDGQAALLNWKANSFTLVPVNSPTFTTDRGFAGDGATSYLDTGYAPSTAGGQMLQNSNHDSLWVQSSGAAGQADIGNENHFTSTLNTGNVVTFRNFSATSNNTAATVTDALGLTASSRSTAGAVAIYRNGALLESVSQTSVAVTANPFFLCARNTTSGGALFSTRRLGAATIGADLSAQNVADLHAVMNSYMTGVGAV